MTEPDDRFESFVVYNSAPICGKWWSAPRADAPDSMDVNHVCMLPTAHRDELGGEDIHVCSCGAIQHLFMNREP
jgi:hypothetical protein